MRRNQGAILQRLLTAAVLIPILLALILSPRLELFFMLFCAVLSSVGIHEFYVMAGRKGMKPEHVFGVVMGGLVVVSAYWGNLDITSMVFFLGTALMAWVHILRGAWSISGLIASVFGVFYVGWLPAHLVLLHQRPGIGAGLVMLLCVAVIVSDSGAYFTGKMIGKHKLAARVSPNKTWEGAVGGVVAAMLFGAALYWLRIRLGWEIYPKWSLLAYVGAAMVLAVVEQIGDLVESMIKRDAGVKDSGGLFPGHGGVLDRCDGFLFAAPVLYYLAALGEV